jgi:hypothetical protein
MAEITGLVLPFFGLILLGYIAARITRQPQEAMGWLNTFIIYVSLPALFFKLLSRTPIEQLARWDYVLTSMVVTYTVFALVFAASILVRRALIGEATIQGLAGAYGNIGYMGPGIAILAFGEPAAVPVALIFCFENIMHFTIAPMMMALSGGDHRSPGALALGVVRKIAFHPFILATIVGVAAAWIEFVATAPGRAVDRLSRAGGGPLRPVRHGSDAGAQAAQAGAGGAGLHRADETDRPSGDDVSGSEPDRRLRTGLGLHGGAAGLTADGNQCVCHCPAILDMGRARFRHRAGYHRMQRRQRLGPAVVDHQRYSAA